MTVWAAFIFNSQPYQRYFNLSDLVLFEVPPIRHTNSNLSELKLRYIY